MRIYKIFALLILSLSFFSLNAAAQKKKPVKKTKPPITKPAPKAPVAVPKTDYKVLVEGSQSKVDTPFIFIARDAETYALIRSLAEGLPESSLIDFSKMAVVAAFAGTRNTGGWSVAVRQAADKTIIDLNAPPKGSMTTQMITYPFQVRAVPVGVDQALNIEAATAWTSQIKTYRVTKGSFESTGGIAGQSKKFNFEGTIGILTFGDHLTYLFNLSGKGTASQRKLTEMTSGIMKNSGLEFARLDAGNFSEIPHPPLKITGTATDKKLTLNLDSLPPTVADGFIGKGKLEASRNK